MVTYEYKSFSISPDSVEEKINELGFQGWRLHTAEPYINVHDRFGLSTVFIVMDRAYESEAPADEYTGPHGIEMKAGPS